MSFILALLEFGPIAAFFIATRLSNIFVATAILMCCSVVGVVAKYILTKKISYFLILTSSVLLVMGSLTLYFNNPNFIKMKPTIVYFISGSTCYLGALCNKLFLKDILLDINMNEKSWISLSKKVGLFCIMLSIINETVWRLLGENAWINFKCFVTPVVLGIFILYLRRFININNTNNQKDPLE